MRFEVRLALAGKGLTGAATVQQIVSLIDRHHPLGGGLPRLGAFSFQLVRMIPADKMPVSDFDLRGSAVGCDAKYAACSFHRREAAHVEIAVPVRAGVLLFQRILRMHAARLR